MDRLKRVLIADEGMRLKPYLCTAGRTTIGCGRNLSDVGLSQEEAIFLLENDIHKATRFALEIFPRFPRYGEARRAALISMIFNLGGAGFLKFRQLVDAVRDEDWNAAAAEAKDSKWYGQVKDRGKRIVEMLADDTFPPYYDAH